MRIVAILKNNEHPEYGEVSIPLPIKTTEYGRSMDLLSSLGIGDALRKDCQVAEFTRAYPTLRCLEGCKVNIDELDYLAKRLDGFDAVEITQFQAMADKLKLTDKERLEAEHILNASGKQEWSLSVIRSILTNEKYYGDVLQQKTFTQDCISKKKVRNTGQLPMYLVTNNHQGIIDRQTFDAVQVEMARRGACKSPSRKNAPTGLSAYKSRYALSERLVCGECGTLYRRCTWSKRGKKKVVWRCVSRLDYGTKYCHKSPTLEEGSLQRTILAAISSVMSQKETIISRITGAMEQTLAPIPGETMSLSEIEQRLAEIDEEVRRVVAQTAEQGLSICADHMKALTDECAELKKQRSRIQEQRTNNSALMKRVDDVASTLRQTSPTITEWDESLIRQLVDTVKVVSAEKIIVYLQGGTQVEQNMVE